VGDFFVLKVVGLSILSVEGAIYVANVCSRATCCRLGVLNELVHSRENKTV